ncbi:gamma-glutamyltransferase 5a isoform X2 [Gadus morhua]|uniref:gamma-glutamyltransferase 5a isoform X2 n=1 Tax=Gadus morhua TaxID=8049 RepID=UPI0011B6795B|nr:glutathione hydrolase 5 proenzyme-like isoform X2 [Gadus morhua]
MARSKARIWTCGLLLVSFLVVLIVCVVMLAKSPCPEGGFTKGAVAADSETCSKVGRDILRSGGSAVDGAIAALLCTSVINPQSMGLGGGTIFTVMDGSGKVKIINARETVPKMFNSNLMEDCSKTPSWTPVGQWIGVPGELRGYELAHQLYGKLPWARLFQPTIKLARSGFPIPPVQARFIPFLENTNGSLRKLYSDKDGNLLKAGDIMKFEKLADTLEILAKQGADAFYTGQIAEDFIRDVQNEGYAPNPESMMGEERLQTYHRFVEACKFANGLKKHLRDPQFNSGAVAKKITEESFADHLRSLISGRGSHNAQYYNMTPYLDSMGTTHVSVLAEDGTAVAATSSINLIFGSKVYSPSTGVILNNQLTDFCGKAEHIVAGEQPPSSMSPSILRSKTRTLVIGASGGSMIITGTALTIMNHLWFGKSLKEATDSPVVFVDSKNELKFEPSFDKSLIEALTSMGQTQTNASYFYNVVNSVEQDNGCIAAVSDLRKQGKAAGY